MRADVFFAIGEPGRAARELPAGAPGGRIGLADVELSTASLPGMVIRAATCRGLQHRARGKPRQDAFALGHRSGPGEPDRLIALVCDGVGSLGRSDEAAALVSRRLVNLGAEGVPWPEAFAYVNEELRKVAEEALAAAGAPDPDGADAHGMATTAVAVSVHREAGEWAGEAAWVGDSTLWHLSGDGRWRLVTGASHEGIEPDYHSTGVTPLPTSDGACTWCGFRISGGALMLMTDGVANPLRWSRDVQESLADWWMRPPDTFTFAAQVGFARKSHMDDRTVVAIWPDGGEADARSQAGDGQGSGSGAAELPG